MKKKGLYFVALVRVSGVIPFTFLNYVIGASSTSFVINLLSLTGNIP